MKAFLKKVFATALGMVVGSLIALVLVPVVVISLVKGVQQGVIEPISDKSILHLRLHGQLVDKLRPLQFELIGDRSIFTENRLLGLYELNRAIRVAKADPRIEGLYLEVLDFDAGWASIQALRRQIEDFAQGGKWVYAYANRYDEMSYYLATAANQIVAEPHGEMEFNGLSLEQTFLKGLFDKLEVEPRVFRVGKFKAAVEPLIQTQMSDENRRQNLELLEDIWSPVRETALRISKKETQRLNEIANGLEVSSARQAKELGLIHETLFQDQLEDRLRGFTVGANEPLELVSPGRLLAEHPVEPASGDPGRIALIFAEGEIVSGVGGFDQIGSDTLRRVLLDARQDEEIAAVVLRINSPGGDALASDVIWRELMVTDKEKPVVVSMGDVAASGGYYIATGGRHVLAEAQTITGSIGVFGVLFNAQSFFNQKTGIQFDRVMTHRHADLGTITRPVASLEAAAIQRDVERVYQRFLDVVQEGRGYEKREDLESIAEGRVWSGARAKELGLIDELGGLDQAVRKARELAGLGEDAEVEIFPQDADPFLQILEILSGETSVGLVGNLKAPLAAVFGAEAGEFGAELASKLAFPVGRNGVYARMLDDLKVR